VGRGLHTISGQENSVLRVDADNVVVATPKSPDGQPVPIAWVRDALERLERNHEIEISSASIGHRSDFVGAVLLTLPGAEAVPGASPPRIRLPR
jgi:hypothetical protein